MTNEQKLDAYKRRLEGETLQSIADSYGVTREYIRQITPGAGPKLRETYVFPNIAKWLAANGVYNYEFAEMINASGNAFGNWMLGKQCPSLYHIEKILEVTGMTFDEAFKRKETKRNGR